MYAAESLVLRVSIVLGMVAAVVTILYFTPLPQKQIKSCDRPCHEYDWPMICRIQLVLETQKTTDSFCQGCVINSTSCDKECLTADGNIRGILTINRQVPGPAIEVCQNDVLVVDVVNKIPRQSIAMHWRGQPQVEAPFMDGVPMITQCPVISYTTFQYKLRATAAGTHLYHAHSGSETADGIYGALIVRQSNRTDPLKKYYDFDDKEHVLLISELPRTLSTDLLDKQDTAYKLLINGKPLESGHLATFNVSKNKRYRFRVAYTGGVSGCPVMLTIERHLIKVIALDGNPTNAYESSSIILAKGERIDFVLKTKHKISDYMLQVNSMCSENLKSGAIIRYKGDMENAESVYQQSGAFMEKENIERKFNTGVCESAIGNICVGDIHSYKKLPGPLRDELVDERIYLSFDYRISPYETKDSLKLSGRKIYRINNITFTYPPSPLLTQLSDAPEKIICASSQKPERCAGQDICECVHVQNIPLGASVEIILSDQSGDIGEHVFHLHGYSFYIVGAKKFDKYVTLDKIKDLNEDGVLFKKNLHNAVLKDTVRVPRYGVVALRFIANNPGFWMLRDENSNSWTRGMDIVFKVGHIGDFVPPPSNFPSCGSWIGPEFFLS